jgi:hypothetical protein
VKGLVSEESVAPAADVGERSSSNSSFFSPEDNVHAFRRLISVVGFAVAVDEYLSGEGQLALSVSSFKQFADRLRKTKKSGLAFKRSPVTLKSLDLLICRAEVRVSCGFFLLGVRGAPQLFGASPSCVTSSSRRFSPNLGWLP